MLECQQKQKVVRRLDYAGALIVIHLTRICSENLLSALKLTLNYKPHFKQQTLNFEKNTMFVPVLTSKI